jgi:hypothetical protein
MLKKLLSLFIVLAAILNGCRKIDDLHFGLTAAEQQQKFFTIPAGTDPALYRVAAALQQQDNLNGKVSSIINRYGYPQWNKAVVQQTGAHALARDGDGRGSSDTTLYIPLVSDRDTTVTAFIYALLNGEVALHYFDGRSYASYTFGNVDDTLTVTAERIALQCMVLDKIMFGHTRFEITDERLFAGAFGSGSIRRVVSLSGETIYGRIAVVPIYQSVCYQTYTQWLSEGIPDLNSYSTICYDVYVGSMYIDNGGGGGGGGSSGGGSPPPHTGGGGSGSGSTSPPGWTPMTGVSDDPLDAIPVDSLLTLQAKAFDNYSDSLFTLSNSNNWEYSMIIVKKNGVIYPKNAMTSRQADYTKFNYFLAPGEVLVGELHTHQGDTSIKRPCFSGDDITFLKRFSSRYNYTMFIECGNVRYVLVIEDIGKAMSFLNSKSDKSIIEAIYNLSYSSPLAYSNWQQATENAVSSFIGSSSTTGIGFYKANAPNKTNFIKLN